MEPDSHPSLNCHERRRAEAVSRHGHDKRVLTIPEFCERYGLGRTMAYEQIAKGKLKSFLCGRKRLIAVDDAERWLLSLKQEAA